MVLSIELKSFFSICILTDEEALAVFSEGEEAFFKRLGVRLRDAELLLLFMAEVLLLFILLRVSATVLVIKLSEIPLTIPKTFSGAFFIEL